MVFALTRLALGIIVALALGSAARANNDMSIGTSTLNRNGTWGTGADWLDTTTPGGSDQATFNQASTYTVTFSADPLAIQDLFVTAGNVTFTNGVGSPRTLNVTSASGAQNVTISGSSSLSLGKGMSLTAGDNLNVQLGGTLNVNTGDHVNANDLFLNRIATAAVTGAGASLNATASATVGDTSGTSTLSYSGLATGSLALRARSMWVSRAASVSAFWTFDTGAAVEVGNLNIGTGSAGTGTVNVNTTGSSLFQMGADTISVGDASGGVGAINVGTTTSGGTLTTGASVPATHERQGAKPD